MFLLAYQVRCPVQFIDSTFLDVNDNVCERILTLGDVTSAG